MGRGRTFLLNPQNSITGTGSANQVAYFDGTNGITGKNAFIFNPSTNTLTVDRVITQAGSATSPSLTIQDASANEYGLYSPGTGELGFVVADVRIVNLTASLFAPITDNAVDLGVSASNRFRTGYFSTSIVSQGANGQASTIQRATTTVSAVTAATLTATNLIPAGSLVLGVDTRVLTTFDNSSGLTTFSIGDGTDADRFGLNIARTAGTTTTNANITITSAPVYAAATSIVLTADAGTFNVAAGQIRITVHYISLTAATS